MKRPFVLVMLAAAVGCGPVDNVSGSAAPSGSPGGAAADGGSGPGPAVVITSPPNGASLALDDHGDDHFFVDVAVELRNVRVAADCGSESSCGVLAVFVDDDACGSPNASTSQGNSATIDFARCGRVIDGTHRVRADIVRGSTVVARSPEIQVTVRRDDDHGDDDDHGGDDLRR
ncbi:MAG: hypothetical protein ACJ79V_21330 [Myxococcales bacterium]